MNFRSITLGVALAIFGLGAAVGIGLAANSISGDSVGLSAEPLSPGDTLAPPAAERPPHRARARAERRRAARRRAALRRAARRERQAASPPSTTPVSPPTTDEPRPATTTPAAGARMIRTYRGSDDSGGGSDDSGPGSDDSGGGLDDPSGLRRQRLRRFGRRLGRLTAQALRARGATSSGGHAPYVEHNYCRQRQSRGGGSAIDRGRGPKRTGSAQAPSGPVAGSDPAAVAAGRRSGCRSGCTSRSGCACAPVSPGGFPRGGGVRDSGCERAACAHACAVSAADSLRRGSEPSRSRRAGLARSAAGPAPPKAGAGRRSARPGRDASAPGRSG